MKNSYFKPHHIDATHEDLAGNNGVGRYIFLPGSEGRAQEIAEHFEQRTVKSHHRGHNLYLGTLRVDNRAIDVASIASGMGCPSTEIILHELFLLGAKRFLRVGTAGSLQPRIVMGDFIDVHAAVRDEDTTASYMPIGIPAVASPCFVEAIQRAASALNMASSLHVGTVHCKSSFYGREFGAGPLAAQNNAYIDLLRQCGILATEMETATLFMQTQWYDHELSQLGRDAAHRVYAGALLGIIGIPPHQLAGSDEAKAITDKLITLAIASMKLIAIQDATT